MGDGLGTGKRRFLEPFGSPFWLETNLHPVVLFMYSGVYKDISAYRGYYLRLVVRIEDA